MATKKNTETSSPDEVPHGIDLLSAHLCGIKMTLDTIAEQMAERNEMVRQVNESQTARDEKAIEALENATGGSGETFSAETLARIERLEGVLASIPGRMDELVSLVKGIPAMLQGQRTVEVRGEVPVVEPKVAPANGVVHAEAQAGAVPGTPVKRGRGRPPKPENCKHEKTETLENGLRRCLKCGTVLEAEKLTAHEQAEQAEALGAPDAAEVRAVAEKAEPETKRVEQAKAESVFKNIDGKLVEVDPETLQPIVKAEPAAKQVVEVKPEPKVEEKKPEPATISDVRATAIAFAEKHGKEKLGEVLKKYGQGNLSSLAPESYRAVLTDLQNGMV